MDDIAPLIEKAVLYSDSVRLDSQLWKVTIFRRVSTQGDAWYLAEVLCDGRLVMRSEDTAEAWYQDIGFIHSPDRQTYIAHIEHSTMGHGKRTNLYRMKSQGKLQIIHHINIENGGPIFRDMDNDGEYEWLWDSTDWYEDYGRPPKWIFVYKMNDKGVLKLWQKIPNRNEVRLPFLGGPSWMEVEEFGFK